MRSDIIALSIVIAFVIIWVPALFKAGEKVADQEIRKITKRFDALDDRLDKIDRRL
jgi:hypothetical protein